MFFSLEVNEMATPYLYVVSSMAPTATMHVAVGNFTSSSDVNLIIAKISSLEICTATAEGLVQLFDVPVHGRIASLELVRPRVRNFRVFLWRLI